MRSLELLYALGALNDEGALSVVGRKMARFPLEPMAAKAIVASAEEGCAEDVVAVLAMLTTDAVFRQTRGGSEFGDAPVGQRDRNHPGRTQYARREGDHATLLEVFRAFSACGAKRRKEWCATNAVNLRAMQKATDIQKQLLRSAQSEGIELRSAGSDPAPMLRSLVAGFSERREAAGGRKLQDGVFGAEARDPPELGAVSATAGGDPVQRARQDESALRARRVRDPAGVARGALPERLLRAKKRRAAGHVATRARADALVLVGSARSTLKNRLHPLFSVGPFSRSPGSASPRPGCSSCARSPPSRPCSSAPGAARPRSPRGTRGSSPDTDLAAPRRSNALTFFGSPSSAFVQSSSASAYDPTLRFAIARLERTIERHRAFPPLSSAAVYSRRLRVLPRLERRVSPRLQSLPRRRVPRPRPAAAAAAAAGAQSRPSWPGGVCVFRRSSASSFWTIAGNASAILAPHCCAIASAEKSLRGPTTNDRPTPAAGALDAASESSPAGTRPVADAHQPRALLPPRLHRRRLFVFVHSGGAPRRFRLRHRHPSPSSPRRASRPGWWGTPAPRPCRPAAARRRPSASSLARRIVARLSGSIAAHASRSSRARGVIAALVAASHARYHGPISFHASAATLQEAVALAERGEPGGSFLRLGGQRARHLPERRANFEQMRAEVDPRDAALPGRSRDLREPLPERAACPRPPRRRRLSPASSASSTTRSGRRELQQLVGVRGALSMSASPTFASVSGSRANQPTVSMLGAWRVTPDALTAPCDGRKP